MDVVGSLRSTPEVPILPSHISVIAGLWHTSTRMVSNISSSCDPRSQPLFPGSQLTIARILIFEDDILPLIGFKVDGSTPTIFSPNGTDINGSMTTFYQSPRLSNDIHTVEIAAIQFKAGLDVNLADPADDNEGMLDTEEIGDDDSTSGSSSRSLPLGPIIGGSVGGAALLLAAIVAWYFKYSGDVVGIGGEFGYPYDTNNRVGPSFQ